MSEIYNTVAFVPAISLSKCVIRYPLETDQRLEAGRTQIVLYLIHQIDNTVIIREVNIELYKAIGITCSGRTVLLLQLQ